MMKKSGKKIIDNGENEGYLDILITHTGKLVVLGSNLYMEETFIDVFDGAGNKINLKKLDGNLGHFSLLNDKTIAFCGYRYTEDEYGDGENKLLIYRIKGRFNIDVEENNNGLISVDSENNVAYINVNPNDGYELDTVNVVDSDGKPILVKKNNDGKFYYDMYDDTFVKVNFKEKLINPKTGLFNYIGLLFSMLVCSFLAFWFIMRKDNKYEL